MAKSYSTKITPQESYKVEYVKCSTSHPKLKLGKYEITGGACSNPIGGPYDIEIGLDHGMRAEVFPWDGRVSVYYPIQDMNAPSNAASFKQMIEWTAEQLKDGKKIHVGCIGGHGRTGTFLVALYAHMFPKQAADAIERVRAGYCEKAVESASQVNFLHKHYGVKKAKGYKEGNIQVYKSSNYGGGSYGESGSSYLGTPQFSQESTDEWWLKRQREMFNREKAAMSTRGKGSGVSSQPQYSIQFNSGVARELIPVEPVRKKGSLVGSAQDRVVQLTAFEADYGRKK